MSLIPQLGFFEIILLAALALMVVGPKELPRLMRGVGKFVRQAQTLAREFMASFEQMARETELEEMRKEIEDLKRQNPVTELKKEFEDAVKPLEEAVTSPEKPSGSA